MDIEIYNYVIEITLVFSLILLTVSLVYHLQYISTKVKVKREFIGKIDAIPLKRFAPQGKFRFFMHILSILFAAPVMLTFIVDSIAGLSFLQNLWYVYLIIVEISLIVNILFIRGLTRDVICNNINEIQPKIGAGGIYGFIYIVSIIPFYLHVGWYYLPISIPTAFTTIDLIIILIVINDCIKHIKRIGSLFDDIHSISERILYLEELQKRTRKMDKKELNAINLELSRLRAGLKTLKPTSINEKLTIHQYVMKTKFSKDTAENIGKLFRILTFIPLIVIFLGGAQLFITSSDIIYKIIPLMLVISQVVMSFRIFNRQLHFPIKTILRAIVELILIVVMIFSVLSLFQDKLLFYPLMSIQFIFYCIWNVIIIFEQTSPSQEEMIGLLGAIAFSVMNLYYIFSRNDFGLISQVGIPIGLLASYFIIYILIQVIVSKNFENATPDEKSQIHELLINISRSLETSSSIRDLARTGHLKEIYFRDFFFDNIKNQVKVAFIECPRKTGRPADLVLVIEKNENPMKEREVLIEFKVDHRNFWKDGGKTHPISEILANIGMYQSFAVVVDINNRNNNVMEDYMKEIEKHPSWTHEKHILSPFAQDGSKHFISFHRDKNGKVITILHEIIEVNYLYD